MEINCEINENIVVCVDIPSPPEHINTVKTVNTEAGDFYVNEVASYGDIAIFVVVLMFFMCWLGRQILIFFMYERN